MQAVGPKISDNERALISRVGWRLMPLLSLMFLAAMLDRQNVGFAKLQMLADLSLSETAYGLGSSLFFVGYVVFEIPISLLVQRYGARLCLAAMVFFWGLATLLQAFATSAAMFYALRFVVGVAQAGFIPGSMFVISIWFPPSHRIRMLGYFIIGSHLGNLTNGLVNGPLLDLNTTLGITGWQWVFIGGGIPTILLAFVVLARLPSVPKTAGFLSEDDKALLAAAHARESSGAETHDRPWAALWDPRVIGFGLIHMMLSVSFYGISYWMPTIISDFGVSLTVNGWLNMAPWALSVVVLLLIPSWLRSDAIIFRACVAISLLGMLSFMASVFLSDNVLRFLALAVGGPCIAALNPCFWSFPPRFFSGARAAASLAAINSIGNTGGFLAQTMMPWVQQQTGSTAAPMLVPAVCLGVLFIGSVVCLLIVPRKNVGKAVPA